MRRTHNLTKIALPILFKQNPPKNILVIITRRIGDVLLTTPLIHTVKTAWPQAKIDVFVFENTRDILTNNQDIHQIITMPSNVSKLEKLKWKLNLWRKYDLAISALPSDRATLFAWIAGKKRIGLLEDKPNQNWKKFLLNDWVAFDNTYTHTVSMTLKLSNMLNIAPQFDVNVSWTEQDSNFVDELLSAKDIQKKSAYAVLHTYPKFAYKMWHPEGWSNLVSWLNQKNIQVILTGSNDPNELMYIQQLLTRFPSDTLNLAGKLNFSQMAYLLKNSTVYVGPDTVTTHLAAAMGTPTVSIFGPSNPVKWGPWPKGYHEETSPWVMKSPTQKIMNVILLQGLGDCVPCHLEGCNRNINSQSNCLNELPASRVISAINTLLP